MEQKYLNEMFDRLSIDGIFVTAPENVFYLSGFTGYGDGTLVITRKEKFILTDFRYCQQVKVQCPDFTYMEMSSSDMGETADFLTEKNIKKLGFENENIGYKSFKELKGAMKRRTKFVELGRELEKMRTVKNSEELACIKKACEISSRAFAMTYEEVKAGMKESDVAALLEYNMKKLGAEGFAFETIVASGIRSSMCHGTATEKVIEIGEPVTVDFGAKYKGYCADMTRTFFIGEPTEKMAEIYNIVFYAQKLALEGFKPGMTGRELDAIARDYISSKGYGEYFGHSLGHGVGAMIHELPKISSKSNLQLTEGMVFSVEPGIYLPDVGGVRIEDLVCVENGKLTIMTSFPKEICKR